MSQTVHAVPEAIGLGYDGSPNFLLANLKSYFRFQPKIEDDNASYGHLLAAAQDRRQVTVTVDIATNDIVAVA